MDVNDKQYSLAKILLIWLVVTLPPFVVTWAVVPNITPIGSMHPGITYWILIILCLIWQFIVSLFLLYKEKILFDWDAIKKRIWLNNPIDPKTKKQRSLLYLWVIPLILLNGVIIYFSGFFDGFLANIIPIPAYTDMAELNDPIFIGQWWILGLALVSALFNYLLGEELLFRGILLPKMEGVFGKYDWIANAVLFGFYHLHKPWALPSILVSSLVIVWPARQYRSIWMAIIIHGFEGIFVIIGITMVILGISQ